MECARVQTRWDVRRGRDETLSPGNRRDDRPRQHCTDTVFHRDAGKFLCIKVPVGWPGGTMDGRRSVLQTQQKSNPLHLSSSVQSWSAVPFTLCTQKRQSLCSLHTFMKKANLHVIIYVWNVAKRFCCHTKDIFLSIMWNFHMKSSHFCVKVSYCNMNRVGLSCENISCNKHVCYVRRICKAFMLFCEFFSSSFTY